MMPIHPMHFYAGLSCFPGMCVQRIDLYIIAGGARCNAWTISRITKVGGIGRVVGSKLELLGTSTPRYPIAAVSHVDKKRLVVHFMLHTGAHVKEDSELLQFYEGNLRWKESIEMHGDMDRRGCLTKVWVTEVVKISKQTLRQ
ncbi:hypothetical protein B0H14DRAFT_2564433 [Mycena olivaceomarginata]|nr:hypothetical protein B0H14DRAFT_2564433 [Mycena olivaceomarginata]